MKTLELWYRALGADELIARSGPDAPQAGPAPREGASEEPRRRDLPEARGAAGRRPLIKDQLPTIFHAEGHPAGEIQPRLRDALAMYRETLPPAYQSLLDRYELRDAAIKVVGIGSVGTSCWVLLFMASEATRCSCRSRRRGPRSWSRTRGRACSRTTASASSTATG